MTIPWSLQEKHGETRQSYGKAAFGNEKTAFPTRIQIILGCFPSDSFLHMETSSLKTYGHSIKNKSTEGNFWIHYRTKNKLLMLYLYILKEAKSKALTRPGPQAQYIKPKQLATKGWSQEMKTRAQTPQDSGAGLWQYLHVGIRSSQNLHIFTN